VPSSLVPTYSHENLLQRAADPEFLVLIHPYVMSWNLITVDNVRVANYCDFEEETGDVGCSTILLLLAGN